MIINNFFLLRILAEKYISPPEFIGAVYSTFVGIRTAVENLFNIEKKHIFTADVEKQIALINHINTQNTNKLCERKK